MKRKITQYTTHHLIKSEDLNHHGTLFAGRGAEWFVESGFIAAANLINPKELICVKIDSLHFQKPVRLGEVVCFNSRIVHAGKSSLIAYVKANGKNAQDQCSNVLVDGFATFVHVDENTRSKPHNIEMEPSSEEDLMILEKLNTQRMSVSPGFTLPMLPS
jgi:acyl-CoA hydrolase